MNLQERAEEKFGKTRADELQSEIKQLSEEIEKLRSVPMDIDDES
jgi:predicted AlkP superfamily phosphohydrolase/phosphomutase